MVPVAGLEPARIAPPHFECGAFANFATPASVTVIQQKIHYYGIGGMRWRDAAKRMFEKCLFIKHFQYAMAGDEQDFESASSAIPTRRHFAGQRMYYTMPLAKNQAKAAEGTRRRREVCEFYKENRPFL